MFTRKRLQAIFILFSISVFSYIHSLGNSFRRYISPQTIMQNSLPSSVPHSKPHLIFMQGEGEDGKEIGDVSLADISRRTEGKASKIKLLLVEDHGCLIDGMMPFLLPNHEIVVVDNAVDLKHMIALGHAEIAVVDLTLDQKLDGLRLMPILQDAGIPFLVFSGTAQEWHIRAAIRMGARGFVDKKDNMLVLAQALEKVETGLLSFPLEFMHKLKDNKNLNFPPVLGPAEINVMDKMFELQRPGSDKVPSTKAIARSLNLSVGRVGNIFHQLFDKFDIDDDKRDMLYEALKKRGYFPGVSLKPFSEIIADLA